MRPELGTFTVSFEPSVPSTPKPETMRLPCAIAEICPSSPCSGVTRSDPPRKLFALAMELTVMSMVWPGLTNAGSTACTATAATFLSCGVHIGRHRNAQLRQHISEGLHRKGRLAGLIAGAVETDHQAITHQLIGAHALYVRHILDAFPPPPAARPTAPTALPSKLL